MPTNTTSGAELPDDDSDLDSSSMSEDDKATMRTLRLDARTARKHERHLAGIAHEHVRAEGIDPALQSYADTVAAGDKPDKGQEDAHARAHFRAFAAAHPEHARPAPAPLTSAAIKSRGPYRW
jgi:hypothetical protein